MPSAPGASLAILKSIVGLAHSPLPIELLQEGKLFFLAPEYSGGLIVQKSFYADFVEPGAAVGGSFDRGCTAIYPLGMVNFRVPVTTEERLQALQKRIRSSDRLAKIASIQLASRRAALIVAQLCAWVGIAEAKKIPIELVAKMVGVSPKLVGISWERQAEHCQAM